jgi:tRNA threonylcarbamoyl adenosine modification protein YeaZ
VLVLAIASASGGCAAAMVRDGVVLADGRIGAEQGLAAAIPPMVAGLIKAEGVPELVAVVVGPGSFTGLRAGISVAQGVGLGAGIKVVGVTVSEALADSLPQLGGRALWVANDSRRGRVFLDRDGLVEAVGLDALPAAGGRVAVAGDAAIPVAAALAARGADVMLTSARRPMPRHVAVVGQLRAEGALEALEPIPLYVDAPEARLPAGGLRPPPMG